MKLHDAISLYEAFRKSLGERFSVNGHMLAAFRRTIGPDTPLAAITEAQVAAFLTGSGPLTSTYHIKHNALRGFYRYATTRGLATETPLPRTIPKQPPCAMPYVYTTEELKRLIGAAEAYQKNRSVMPPLLMRTIILLQYGAALRSAETLALRMSDVSLDDAVLTVQETKFFKNRLVPIGAKLTKVLQEFAAWRSELGLPQDKTSHFFLLNNGRPANQNTVHHAFKRIRRLAKVERPPGSRWQPRLHDLRHSAAVHRLIAWYRAGEDVQAMLPALSVYLGHQKLSATQSYLGMTPELLGEAGRRFELFVAGKDGHD